MTARLRNYKAWLDKDGRHIWFMHDCLHGQEISMLPYPTWKAAEDHKSVTPSIVCDECHFHETVALDSKREMHP